MSLLENGRIPDVIPRHLLRTGSKNLVPRKHQNTERFTDEILEQIRKEYYATDSAGKERLAGKFEISRSYLRRLVLMGRGSHSLYKSELRRFIKK